MIKLTSSEQTLFEEIRQHRLKAAETFGSHLFSCLFRATADIYPDPAHFVYELLQSADDVEATPTSPPSSTSPSTRSLFIPNRSLD